MLNQWSSNGSSRRRGRLLGRYHCRGCYWIGGLWLSRCHRGQLSRRRARHRFTGDRSPRAAPSSIGRPRTIQRKPLWARVESGLTELGGGEARRVKHEWLHRGTGRKRKDESHGEVLDWAGMLVHKRGPLALDSALGASIADPCFCGKGTVQQAKSPRRKGGKIRVDQGREGLVGVFQG